MEGDKVMFGGGISLNGNILSGELAGGIEGNMVNGSLVMVAQKCFNIIVC